MDNSDNVSQMAYVIRKRAIIVMKFRFRAIEKLMFRWYSAGSEDTCLVNG